MVPFLLSLGLGCAPYGEPKSSPGLAEGDSGEATEEDHALGIATELAPLAPTVLRVTWSPPLGVESFVEFGTDEAYGLTAWPLDGRPGEALLFGVPAATTGHFRVVVDDPEGRWTSSDQTYETGDVPSEFPAFDLVEDQAGDWGRFVLLSTLFLDADNQVLSTVVVLDRGGLPVWWTEPSTQEIHGARLSLDQQAIMVSWKRAGPQRPGGIGRVGLDGEVQRRWDNDMTHHDFMELDGDRVLMLEMDIREFDDKMVAGDNLVEVDAAGERRLIWSAWDTLPPDSTGPLVQAAGVSAVDWTHANGIAYDPHRHEYILSLFWLQQLVFVNADTGAVTATLGGSESSWALTPDARFGPQHAPVVTDDGLWLFDNGFLLGAPSRVMRLDLDDEAATAALAWDWVYEGSPDFTIMEGDVRPMASGHLFASFGSLGSAWVFSPEGDPTWQVQAREPVVLARGEAW